MKILKKYARFVYANLFELIYIFYCVFEFMLYPFWREKPNKGRPIILVHGFLGHGSNWLYCCFRLRKLGYCVYTITLGSPFHSIEEYVERLNEKIRWIVRETHRKDLILIGHSMGGLISSLSALENSNISGVITLGSPLNGTKIAPLGLTRSAMQMKINSLLIQSLNQKINEATHIPFLHVASDVDLFIWPQSSASRGAKHAQTELISNLGHIGFLFSDKVFQMIVKFIQAH